jgi:multicomponent Na+:H+ antiporter subunit G
MISLSLEWPVAISVLAAAFFALVAVLGVWRLPDALSKMHAATKSGAFATAWALLGAVLHFGSVRVALLATLFLFFYYLTAPLGAMYLARALRKANTSADI